MNVTGQLLLLCIRLVVRGYISCNRNVNDQCERIKAAICDVVACGPPAPTRLVIYGAGGGRLLRSRPLAHSTGTPLQVKALLKY